MARFYTVSFSATVTAAGGDTDLFEFVPADDKPIRLMGLILAQQEDTTEANDYGVRLSIIRLPATFTSSNGTATTPRAIDEADPAAGFAAEVNGTTVATTSGTAETIDEFGWIVRNTPLERWWPDERLAPGCRQAAGLVVRLQTTLPDDATIQGTAYVAEY